MFVRMPLAFFISFLPESIAAVPGEFETHQEISLCVLKEMNQLQENEYQLLISRPEANTIRRFTIKSSVPAL